MPLSLGILLAQIAIKHGDKGTFQFAFVAFYSLVFFAMAVFFFFIYKNLKQ